MRNRRRNRCAGCGIRAADESRELAEKIVDGIREDAWVERDTPDGTEFKWEEPTRGHFQGAGLETFSGEVITGRGGPRVILMLVGGGGSVRRTVGLPKDWRRTSAYDLAAEVTDEASDMLYDVYEEKDTNPIYDNPSYL